MASASRANHLGHPSLRVLPGGGPRSPEGIGLRKAERRMAAALIRAGIAVLTLPLAILAVLLVASASYPIEHVLPLALPLLAPCAGLMALGIAALVCALHRLRRHEPRYRAQRLAAMND